MRVAGGIYVFCATQLSPTPPAIDLPCKMHLRMPMPLVTTMIVISLVTARVLWFKIILYNVKVLNEKPITPCKL